MDRTELYLKTAFCCMACDGEIAAEEISAICQMPIFARLDPKQMLDDFVAKLKAEGHHFLHNYLNEIKMASLSEDEECKLASVAVQTIEADNAVEYNEVSFFKKIRRRLNVSDEKLLEIIPENSVMPDREDYLMPDITNEDDLSLWTDSFQNIVIQD